MLVRTLLLLATAAILAWNTQAYIGLESGPLVGHTTHDSTKIWALAAEGTAMTLVYQIEENAVSYVVDMPQRADANHTSLVEIKGLAASTPYTYAIHIDNLQVAQGKFTTAPLPNTTIKFDYLLASCMNYREGDPKQPVWNTILEKEPSFAILPGDTIYLNNNDWNDNREVISDRVLYRNMMQRNVSHFANFIKSVPTYATWDDHEYGINNADYRQPGKENSLAVWKTVWANPGYGSSEVPGIFYSYYWGNVHFIVLDGRWYRNKGKEKTQFGDEQKEWLFDQLKGSKAAFKIIVTGADIMAKGYSADVRDIGNFVTEHNIYGVLFNSGDIHRNEFKTQERNEWPYKVTQITSSGIARDQRFRPFAIIDVDTTPRDPEITAYFYGADSYSDETTWSNEPNLKCSQIEGRDRFKESRCTEIIRLSDLTPNALKGTVLESPMGGEMLNARMPHAITWRTFGTTDSVRLDYSTNAGESWKSITSWIANSGSYVWTVPTDISDRVKVRVISDDNDQATESFTVLSII